MVSPLSQQHSTEAQVGSALSLRCMRPGSAPDRKTSSSACSAADGLMSPAKRAFEALLARSQAPWFTAKLRAEWQTLLQDRQAEADAQSADQNSKS